MWHRCEALACLSSEVENLGSRSDHCSMILHVGDLKFELAV